MVLDWKGLADGERFQPKTCHKESSYQRPLHLLKGKMQKLNQNVLLLSCNTPPNPSLVSTAQLNDQDELTAFRPQFPWYLVVSLQWRLYVHSGCLQTLQTTSDTKSFTNLTARLFQRRDCADHGGAQQQWGWGCVFYLDSTTHKEKNRTKKQKPNCAQQQSGRGCVLSFFQKH